jgi:hypothetical protein
MKFDEKRLNSIEMKLKRNVNASNKDIVEDQLWVFEELRRAWKELEKTYGAEESFPGLTEIQYRSDVDVLKDALTEAELFVRNSEKTNGTLQQQSKQATEEMKELVAHSKRIKALIQERLKEAERLTRLAG